MDFDILWYDSLGAKCSSLLVKTRDIRILIDPGAAVMQPSFPLSTPEKLAYKLQALARIQKAGEKADLVVISHYHFDHFQNFDSPLDMRKLLTGKEVWVKDPNQYINKSQWDRARYFFDQIMQEFSGTSLKEHLEKPQTKDYPDPLEKLPLAREKKLGDYQERRENLLKKGLRSFKRHVKRWTTNPWVPELEWEQVKLKFADGKILRKGNTIIKFKGPLWHGIEYDRIGWVLSIVVDDGKEKLVHTSDLQGPMIEDYAEWLILEKPDYLFLDGPPTYLLGFMMSRINLHRAIQNVCRIIQRADTKLLIYDHHLPRDEKYRKKVTKVYSKAKKEKKKVLTAAEYFGKTPMVLRMKKDKERQE